MKRLSLVLFALASCSREMDSVATRAPSDADPLRAIAQTEVGRHVIERASKVASPWRVGPTSLDVRSAATSDAPTRLSIGEGQWLEIRPLDLAPVPMRSNGSLLVGSSVAHALDVVHVRESDRFEELRVLHDARAPKTARYQLRFGPGFADVRAKNGRVEIVDHEGRVRLASDALWARDAAQSAVPVSLTIERSEGGAILELSVAEGAWTYPLVVDPGWAKVAGTLSAQRPTGAFELGAGGKVLIVGLGASNADLYDPATGYTAKTGSRPSSGRAGGSMIKSGSGKVYVVAGSSSAVERYDAPAGTWSTVAPMPVALVNASAWPVGASKLLVTGGVVVSAYASAKSYLFDESTGAWTTEGDIVAARSFGATAVLADGRPMILGGVDVGSGTLSLAEIFDPTTKKWSSAAPMKRARGAGTVAATLPSGKVIVLGGGAGTTSELYDPSANTWSDVPGAGPSMSNSSGPGQSYGLAVLKTGRVLYAGIDVSSCASVPWIYDPLGAGTWSKGSSAPNVLCDDVPAVLSTGQAIYASTFGSVPITWTEPSATGATCASDFECLSGHCVDGVCCDTLCESACQACNVAGKAGTCSAAPIGAPVGGRSCTGSGACKGTCDGTSPLCVIPGAGVVCKAASCSGTTFTAASKCDGTGTCVDPPSAAGCGAYACTTTGCRTTCTSDVDCAAGKACSAGACGEPLDGGTGDTAAPTIDPKPVVTEVPRCSRDGECATGHCVEGVCCDTACDAPCHSCALLTSPGICTAEPIGVDLKSNCGAAFSCTGTCDGAGKCIGAGKGTMCGRNRCTGSSEGVGASFCDSPGGLCTVGESDKFDCAPYACEPAFGACRSNCAASSDCANGFVCDIGAKSCIVPAPPADASGCALGPRGGASPAALLVLIALVLKARSRGGPSRAPSPRSESRRARRGDRRARPR